MKTSVARAFYNASGITPRNDPACRESRFAVDRVQAQLATTIRPGQRVLDLGCNAGRFVFAAEELGAIAVGLDCANVPLRHARTLARRRCSEAKFVRGNCLRPPFPDRTFDVVLLINNIVEYSYRDAETMAGEVGRILKPAGRFCVSMQDGVLRHETRGRPSGYMASTGKEEGSYTIPGRGRFRYDAWLWTVGFLKHVLARNFICLGEKELPESRFWLVFRKTKRAHG